jgi:DNA-binding CsgD family transcriptional regulator
MPWGKSHADKYLKDDYAVLQGRSKLNYIENQLQTTGKTMRVRVSKKPLYNARGNIIGIVCTYEFIKELNSINISPQQQKCLQLTANGHSAKQIAKILGLSQRTVEYYLQLIKNKLKCKTNIQLIKKAQWYQFESDE